MVCKSFKSYLHITYLFNIHKLSMNHLFIYIKFYVRKKRSIHPYQTQSEVSDGDFLDLH